MHSYANATGLVQRVMVDDEGWEYRELFQNSVTCKTRDAAARDDL